MPHNLTIIFKNGIINSEPACIRSVTQNLISEVQVMKNFMKKLGVALLGAIFTVVAIVALYLVSGIVVFVLNALRSGISALAAFIGGNLFMAILSIIILCVGLTVFYMFCFNPFKGWITSRLEERKERKEDEAADEDEPERVSDMLESRRANPPRRRYSTAGKL